MAACESGHDPSGQLDGWWATNGGSYGLFQVNGINRYADGSHMTVKPGWETFLEDWMVPARNIWYAFQIWLSWGGWRPWGCRPVN